MTVADMNKEPRESDWRGVYRIHQEQFEFLSTKESR